MADVFSKEPDIPSLRREISGGKISARIVTEHFLNRISLLDKTGPSINAVLSLNPLAREEAEELDRNSDLVSQGPLRGIPVLLKDNIDTSGIPTTAGSLALDRVHPPKDAFIVRRLKSAGAVIIGKANLSEWANFRSSRSSSGWSSLGGQTRNPYILDRTPCGSSSGSAAAVSAGYCPAAVGTETDGSIICPSHINGIVGIKPTLGLISRSGIIPIAHSQDTAGPMAKTVLDAAVLLGVMAGPDPEDPATLNPAAVFHSDYTRFLDPAGLRGARIGVARNFFGFHPGVDSLMEECVSLMKSEGAVIVDPANISIPPELGEAELTVLLYEFKNDLNSYLKKLGPRAGVKDLAAIIAFNEAHKARVMPWFGQERMTGAQEKGNLKEPEYLKALEEARRLSRQEGLDRTLRTHSLDAIIAPSGGPAWLIDWVNGDTYRGGSSTPSAVAGYPAITVPAGFIHGLPVGISFMTGPWQEPILLKLAYAFEQASRARKPPEFVKSILKQ